MLVGMLEAQGRLLHGGERVPMRAGVPAAIKFRHLRPVFPATLCCPCCDPLPSAYVILRTGPYYYFSSQNFLWKDFFLKNWDDYWNFEVFLLQSAPHPWPLLPVLWRVLCPPSALHSLCDMWPSCIPHPLSARLQLMMPYLVSESRVKHG